MLSAAQLERLAAFEAFTVAHPKLLAADRQIRRFIEHPAGSALLLVFGPTGAGKTTLLSRVREKITSDWAAILNADPERLGPVAFECPPPLSGVFSWSEWFRRGLGALSEPGVAEKVFVPDDSRLPIEVSRTAGVRTLEQAFIATARRRRPPMIGLDEAQQLAGVGHGPRLLAQLDYIKSVADAAEVPIVLVGTYDLLGLRNLSGQLGRRSQEVHFPRYRFDDTEDWRNFRSVINTFAQQLPTDPEAMLGHAEDLYLGSAGCVGTLKQWFIRAYASSLDEGARLEWTHLATTRAPVATLDAIANEIVTGEERVVSGKDAVREIRGLLGMARRPRKPVPKSPQGRVGRRAPSHDPVGTR